jgi:SAM-dependent methyltransferase
MLEPSRRYDTAAEAYSRYRPSSPSALLDWILATTGRQPPARVADVGCGTGIATRLFAERGLAAVGIDHNEPMLSFAARAGGARYLRAGSTATALASGSVDLVVAAQCFHWFDAAPTLQEFARILRPGGWCTAFWNLAASTPFLDEYDRVLRAHTPACEYEILLKQNAAPAVLRAAPGVSRCQEAEFPNSQALDRDGLLGRAYSSSCVRHGVRNPAAFERALTMTFNRHQRDGVVELRYRTVGLCWQPGG